VMGDAASIFDPFYSTGMVMMSYEAESITSVIHSKLQGDMTLAARKVKVFDDLVRGITRTANHLIAHHNKHLGHASCMSWRMYIEISFTFGIIVPSFVGRWHTCPDFAAEFVKGLDGAYRFREYIYCLLDEAVERNMNLGFMDVHNTRFWGYQPEYMWDYDHIRTKLQYEPKRTNIFKRIAWTNIYLAGMLATLKYKIHGASGLWDAEFLKKMGWHAKNITAGTILGIIHAIKHVNVPDNRHIAARTEEFKTYTYKSYKPMPWLPEQKESGMM